METDFQHRVDGPTIHIWDSELRHIAGNAWLWDQLETGGELWGCGRADGSCRIDLATGPGAQAKHTETRFQQDTDHTNRLIHLLSLRAGVDLMGAHHSHGHIPLPMLSDVDHVQADRITKRLKRNRWLSVLVTRAPGSAPERPMLAARPLTQRIAHPFNRNTRTPRMCIHVFAFRRDDTGRLSCHRCPVCTLAGTSPLRQAIATNGLISEQDLGYAWAAIPMTEILIDRASDSSQMPDDVPETLETLFQSLPVNAQRNIRLEMDSRHIHVWIEDEGELHVVFHRDPPYNICYASRQVGSGEFVEATDATLRAFNASRQEAYVRLKSSFVTDEGGLSGVTDLRETQDTTGQCVIPPAENRDHVKGNSRWDLSRFLAIFSKGHATKTHASTPPR